MLGHVQQEERVLSAQPQVEQSCSYSRHTVCFFNFLLRASQKWSVLHLDLGDLDSGSNWETLASESANGSIGNMSPSRQRHALWLALRGTPKFFSRESGRSQKKLCGAI